MKSIISFITLLIFVNTVTNHMVGAEAKEPVPVLDTDGDSIQAEASYFIRPVLSGGGGGGGGGGLTAAITKGNCVYGVVETKLEADTGVPVAFFPEGYKAGDAVHESTDLNIGFLLTFGCPPSGIWKVGDYDESTKQNFVMLGGSVGNPGNGTVANWFKIQKLTTGDYKIVYCPSVCDFCAVTCRDVGIYVHNGLRRLALSESPFIVQFQKFKFEHKTY